MSNWPNLPENYLAYNFLITGGAGFIGSNLAEFLVNKGARHVRVLDNLSTGSKKNITSLLEKNNFEFIEGDITSYECCEQACDGVDFVFHQAALGSVQRSIEAPINTNNANVVGFLNMLEASRNKRVKRFVYASSSSVYGDNMDLPKKEERIGNPISPYAVTKRVNELYAKVFYETYGMETIGLRYFNVFGPKQSPSGAYAAVIPLFIDAVLSGKSVKINGDGTQMRDFTYIENVVLANICAAFANKEGATGKVYNVAFGESTSLNELLRLINEIAGANTSPIYGPPRIGDIKDSLADISMAKDFLGYMPLVNIKQGLQHTFNWFKQNY